MRKRRRRHHMRSSTRGVSPARTNQKVLIGVLIVLLVIAGSLAWYSQRLGSVDLTLEDEQESTLTTRLISPTATPRPTATPTPRPIPHGKWGFSVSGGDKNKPQMSRGFLDPYDPAKGAHQTIT